MADFFGAVAESFDFPILDWIAQNLYCPFLDTFMSLITHLGDGGIFWIAVAVIFLLIPKYRKTGLGMAFALLMGVLVCNVTMKPLFARIRPYDYQLEQFGRTIQLLIAAPTDYSFPSGHTLASFEAATVILLNNRKLGIPAMILACLVAFSRLYLYVHYPTDVLFSVFMGILFAYLGNKLAHKAFDTWSLRKKSN